MGFNGIGAALMVSVFVVITIAIFIAVLNDQAGAPPCAKSGAQLTLDGLNVWHANATSGIVTGIATSGARDKVKTDGRHCSTSPAAAKNSDTWFRTGFGPLASSNFTLTLTVLRIVSAVAGLGIIVVIWRAAMADKG